MTKLESIIERLKQVPAERQDAIAAEIDLLLSDDDAEDLLSDDQWAEIEARLDKPQSFTDHAEIVRKFRARMGT